MPSLKPLWAWGYVLDHAFFLTFIGVFIMMKFFKSAYQAAKNLYESGKEKALAFFGLTTVSSVSYAAVPASVTTGISDATADVTTIGAAIMGVVIVIVAFNWLRRVIH